ncbi:MAG TPA: hypothetical protein VF032_09390 [Thermoleophilaceae bacterium]
MTRFAPVGRAAVCGVVAALAPVVAGCAGSSSAGHAAAATTSTVAQRPRPHRHARRRGHHHRHHRSRTATSRPLAGFCPASSHVLDGVYHPERLTVLSPCREAAGVVEIVRTEEDGDSHFDIRLDPAYRSMLAPGNAAQNGDLVVEYMPRDHGHLYTPQVGEHITLVGAWVDDTDHSWNELHPVWAARIGSGDWQRSGPQYGGSPAQARSYDAISSCRTAAGSGCQGYANGGSGGLPRTSSGSSSNGSTHCDPNYAGRCLDPNAYDYDCAGGSGDGPKYVQGPVRVVGNDHYHLDANGDGIACAG